VEVDFTIEKNKSTIEFNTSTFNLFEMKSTKEVIKQNTEKNDTSFNNQPYINNNKSVSNVQPKSVIKNVKQTKKTIQKPSPKKKTNYRLINN
jgi:hypothetical protein